MGLPCPSGAKRIRFMPKTYTFHAQDVYVFTAKRIRFTRDTYTFRSGRQYVWLFHPQSYPFPPNDVPLPKK